MKKSKFLLVNSLLGSLYFLIMTAGLSNMKTPTGDYGALANGLTKLVLAPHLFMILLAAIFGWLGFFLNKSGFALTSAILYCVAAGLFIPLSFYQMPLIIIGFIAYSRIKKTNISLSMSNAT